MTVTLGATGIGAVYLGATSVEKMYVGADLVWSAGPAGDPYKAAVLADSPDLYVRLDKATPVDESGNGHTLTAYSGTATFTSDPIYGDVLDGGSKAWSTDAYTSAAQSFEVVVDTTGWIPHTETIIGFDPGTSGSALYLSAQPRFYVGPVFFSVPRRWLHIVGTINASESKMYSDGDLKNTQGGATLGARQIAVAARLGGYTPYSGRIHSVVSYSHVLTAPQVAAHYAALPA